MGRSGLAAGGSERYHSNSMVAKLGALVERAAGGLGVALQGRAATDLTTWLERLEEWNDRIDLTAARPREEMVDLMLADALVLGGELPRGPPGWRWRSSGPICGSRWSNPSASAPVS